MRRLDSTTDIVHLFSTRRAELGRFLLSFVDLKVCAVSDVRSGVNLVVRKELR